MPLHREPVLTEELVLTEEPVLTAALLAKKEAACAGACRSSRSSRRRAETPGRRVWAGRAPPRGRCALGKAAVHFGQRYFVT